MGNLATRTTTASACPANVSWCTAHETDRDGQSHAATPVTTAAGTISMHQIAPTPDGIFAAQTEPTIWFGDVPMSVAAAAEAAAVLAALVASALVTVTR